MSKLYELTDGYAELYAQLDDCTTAEELQDVLDELALVGGAITDKGEAYARIMRNADGEADMLDAEIKRLTKKRDARRNAAARMKEYMHYAMEIAGITEIPTSIGKWKIAVNPWSVKVIDESEIPEKYLIPQAPKIDKAAILDAFKRGGEIPKGCDVVRTQGVRFR